MCTERIDVGSGEAVWNGCQTEEEDAANQNRETRRRDTKRSIPRWRARTYRTPPFRRSASKQHLCHCSSKGSVAMGQANSCKEIKAGVCPLCWPLCGFLVL